ncbi:TPA: hypothetical protein EYP37_03160, partial [Candidatus Poribacteria bacterium]|nr:hypothetical protein [Candidatus Poribacteria bacterium]
MQNKHKLLGLGVLLLVGMIFHGPVIFVNSSKPSLTLAFGSRSPIINRLTGAMESVIKEITVTASDLPDREIKDHYAIVIGISDYLNGLPPDSPDCGRPGILCDLRYTDEDAQAFYDLLVDPEIGNFSRDRVALLLNEQATKANITDAFGRVIALAEEDDLVVIYYSGHGGRGPDLNGDEGEGDPWDEYYIAYDTDVGKLFGTGIRDDEFGDWMDSLESRHVVIFLDSCFSGGATREIKGMSPEGYKATPSESVFNDFSLEDRVLIAASQENQVSFESDELGHGVFTYFLLEGLKGEADLNRDGRIVAEEVYRYVKPRVKEYVVEHFNNAVQEPLMKGEPVDIPVAPGQPLVGVVTGIEGGKDWAVEGDKLYIDLGSEDGVQVGDIFEVYHEEYVTR